MMTDRIRSFLDERRPEGPCLVVDLDVVRRNYEAFARALPDSRIFYAVKANPAPEILSPPRLARLLLRRRLGARDRDGARRPAPTPDRISYGNTIKKERDIARAHALGVTLFAVDCVEEVEKIARAAPGARVFCRILTDGAGAEWPLSRKFGCVAGEAVDVLARADGARPRRARRLVPCRLAADRPEGLEPRARAMPRRSSAPRPSAACSSPWSISAAAFRPAT